MSAGDSDTAIPAARNASIFSAAVPFPPEMMAPACPIRFPFGAVSPAMYPTTGLRHVLLDPLGRVLFGRAADLPDQDDRVGPRVRLEGGQDVDEVRPVDRVAADAHAGGLPQPQAGQLVHRLVRERPRAGNDADRCRAVWMLPGMIPALHSPGVMTPGQFGPTRRVFFPSMNRFTFTMSRTGIPSVMQMTRSSPESNPSQIASAAKAGGTKMTDTFGPGRRGPPGRRS